MFWKALASCGFCSHTQINWVWTSCIENTTIILLAFSIGSDVKNLICKSRRPAEPLWPGQLQKKRTATETEIYFSWGRVEMWFKKGTLWIIVCVQLTEEDIHTSSQIEKVNGLRSQDSVIDSTLCWQILVVWMCCSADRRWSHFSLSCFSSQTLQYSGWKSQNDTCSSSKLHFFFLSLIPAVFKPHHLNTNVTTGPPSPNVFISDFKIQRWEKVTYSFSCC